LEQVQNSSFADQKVKTMKGIKFDVKKGKMEIVEDNTPLPKSPPSEEPKGVDLMEVAKALEKIKQIEKELEELKKK